MLYIFRRDHQSGHEPSTAVWRCCQGHDLCIQNSGNPNSRQDVRCQPLHCLIHHINTKVTDTTEPNYGYDMESDLELFQHSIILNFNIVSELLITHEVM